MKYGQIFRFKDFRIFYQLPEWRAFGIGKNYYNVYYIDLWYVRLAYTGKMIDGMKYY